MHDVIPEDVKQFILQYIDSIVELEGLLLVRANPQEVWDARAIARRLYIEEPQAKALILRLAEQGFLHPIGDEVSFKYQYRATSPDLEAKLALLAEVYRKYLVPVTNLIHSRPKNRVQEFANAFRIRKG